MSAYKKVESGENQISIASLKNLHKEMYVSTDFVLFGRKQDLDEVWKDILNCSEADKLFIVLRLLVYFTEVKKGIFPPKEEKLKEEQELLQLMHRLQKDGRVL